MDEQTIRKNSSSINFMNIDYGKSYPKYSISFYREFSTKINWVAVSRYNILTDRFISEFCEFLDWGEIAKRNILTTNQIENYVKFVKFEILFTNNKFAEESLEKFIEFVKNEYLVDVFIYNNSSPEFVSKYIDRIQKQSKHRNKEMYSEKYSKFLKLYGE